jgi:hypothetical protein
MICTAQGDACDMFAAAVDDGHRLMEEALGGVGIAIIATRAAGILLTVFTSGGSDAAAAAADVAEAEAALTPVAAEVAATVASETAAVLPGDLIGAVDAAVGMAPAVEQVEAETTQVGSAIEDDCG